MEKKVTLDISEAVREDAAEILEYFKAVCGESDNLMFGAEDISMTVEDEERFIEEYENAEYSIFLVGRIEGKIVSTVAITSGAQPRVAHNYSIGMSVLKDYWGHGIGTLMMIAVLDYCRITEHCKCVQLGVKADNAAAIGLYEKMGFEEVGRHKDHIMVGETYYDMILMDLHL